MRVGLLAPPWCSVPPRSYGGTEQIVHLLAEGLVAAGNEVALFATGDSRTAGDLGSFFDQPPRPMGLGTFEAAHASAGYRYLTGMGVDVVHDHTSIGALVAPDVDRLVVTNHGPFDPSISEVLRRIADHAAVVAISRSQAAMGAAAGVPIAAVIHHGIDVGSIPIGAGDGGYALFLGRMAGVKGAADAIAIARRARVPLVLAGKCADPEELEYFDREVAPQLGDDVEWRGEVDPEEKHRLLGGAMALINPISWPEPFGLVMTEALACGTPVVTTPCGAAPEIVDDGTTGFVRDRPGLADALGRVGQIDRAACRRSAVERFSVDRMVEEHLRLYEQLL